MQDSSEGTHVENSLAGRIDGFLFALTRFGRDPSRYSASAELCQLPGRDIAAEYIKLIESSDDPVPISINDLSLQSGCFRFLEDTLSSFLREAMARPDGAEPNEEAIGLATWYLIEYISSMSDPLGQIYSAKLSIDGRTSDCIFITCSEQLLVIRMHAEEA
ncbi:hypothetical protein N5J43_18405 [Pseudomonas nicosulfuronedens]|uniref:hypothetical protein n=1 Tax=Pseudomonas nicosulfuronedens TaxID=2571105 RepID=UPI0024480DCC|nr:hypothetical protein [Pseudomonas nicosulfuronedens]MDH1009631.1 hypothetical protein [Pseudomonas nicosulfuronedens]MDH1980930.1 hypothetical protein [Pseudomonas nicosulfuronedens]MDH2027809.1 hypothetical protein [Pseudomonas nicosulfuronedens]